MVIYCLPAWPGINTLCILIIITGWARGQHCEGGIVVCLCTKLNPVQVAARSSTLQLFRILHGTGEEEAHISRATGIAVVNMEIRG